MHQAITKLLSVASEPIADVLGRGVALQHLSKWGKLGEELAELLACRNGFYAYESALCVRPLCHKASPLGLSEWNVDNLWKSKYIDNLTNVLFFAEDVFGGQFCIRGEAICTFDPETGALEEVSSSLGSWAEGLMADYEYRTGYPLAHAWQVENSPLLPGLRLLPKVPFICGGRYEAANLYPLDEVRGMLFRASIANQIQDLPDGAQVVFDV